MAYQALYREWRPKNFSQMVGQQAIIETLRNQVITHRIAHAYLFCGSRGTGKTSTAKILAKAINCLHPENGDPCGNCENCRRADNEETLDIIEIDAASNNGVNEIRDLRETVKYPPQYGFFKVYIIDEVHMLTSQAFNALLKTLEEPPAHIVFILATTEPQKLPQTILSRCQRFDFGRIRIPEIMGRLREAADGSGATATDGALMLIARSAEGGMRDALSILDMCLGYRNDIDEELVRSILGTSDSAFLFSFCEAFSQRDAKRIFTMIGQLISEGKDPAVFARDVCRHIRALLIAKAAAEDLTRILDITADEADEYFRQGEQFTISRLMMILDLFLALETDMRYATAPRLALENTCLKCCLKIEQTDGQALQDRIAELEKQLDDLQNRMDQSTDAVPALKQEQKAERRIKPTTDSAQPTQPSPLPGKAEGSGPAEAWKNLMDRLKKSDPSIWSMLTQGELAGTSDGRYVWRPHQPGGSMFLIPLNKPEKKQKIADCLSEITGVKCDFVAADDERRPGGNTDGEKDYVQNLRDLFGKDSVIVRE